MRVSRGLLLVFLFILFVTTGCPPLTPIRRTALVPRSVTPAQSGAPIGGRGVKAFGYANSIQLSSGEPEDLEALFENVPQEGAPGLLIPKLHVGGGAYAAPNEWVEIGAQLHYAQLEWADPNVDGVLPFPPEMEDQDLWMGGPGVRVNVPIEDVMVTPSFLLEANLVSIPQAVYLCEDDCRGTIDENGNLVPPTYTFERKDEESFLLPSLHAHVTVSPLDDYLHIFGMIGTQRGVQNIGFDPDINNLESDTLEGYWYGDFALGVEGRFKYIFGTVLFQLPFATPDYIDFGPSITASLGAIFK